MGGAWVSWPLWGKMCFVLGCCIAFTLSGGYCKSRYDKRKLKKLQAIAERKKAQRERYGQQDIAEIRRNAVPFGIRAIESGIEVEGVWISRSNLNSPSGSPQLTPLVDAGKRPEHSSSSSLASQLQVPPPLQIRTQMLSSHSSLSINTSSNGFDRAVLAEPLSSNNATPEKSSSSDGLQAEMNRAPIQRNSAALSALEGSSLVTGPSTRQPLRTGQETNPERSSDSSEPSSQSASHYVPKRPHAGRFHTTSENLTPSRIDLMPFTENGDEGYLGSLHKHRMSHAAEMGQLTPRVRRSGISSEYTLSILPSGTSTPKEAGDYFNHPQPSSNQQSPLLVDPTVVPFQDFVESHPVPPQDSGPGLQVSAEIERKEGTSQPSSKAGYDGHSHRNSVTRIVNAGFEVHPAGTFGSIGEPSDWDIDLESGEKRGSRKLKKKCHSDSLFTEHI